MTGGYRGYLQRRLLIPLLIVIFATITAVLVSTVINIQDSIEHDAENHIHTTKTVYQTDISNDTGKILALMEMVQTNTQLRDAFQRRDRDALLQISLPLYQRLHNNHHITHFYFTTPDRINLLRVHNP